MNFKIRNDEETEIFSLYGICFDGVFDVVAESKEDARQKVLQNCGLVMGGSVHSILPDEEINWAFSTHPEVRTGQITVQEEQTT